MDFQNLYLSTSGRIGQKSFWMGWLILLAVSIGLGFVIGLVTAGNILISSILGLVLMFPGYALMAKRFQDFGKPGIYAAVPYGLSALLQVLNILVGAGMMATMSSMPGMAAPTWLVGIFGLIGLGFLIWAGITKGDAGPNAYGPPPASATPAA